MVTAPPPLGRWLDTVTPANTKTGDLVWLPRATGGIRGQVALAGGRGFAVIRPVGAGRRQQWSVRVKGFVWFPIAIPERSVARAMGVKESSVGSFQSLAKARAAVAEAHRLLDDHLRLQATV